MPQLTITTPAGSYDVLVGPNLLHELPARMQALGLSGRLWLISDSAVFSHHGAAVESLLRGAATGSKATLCQPAKPPRIWQLCRSSMTG